MVKRRGKGNALLSFTLAFLVAGVLGATLTLAQVLPYNVKQMRQGLETRYNLLSVGELVFDNTKQYASAFVVMAEDSPVKGGSYYQRLMESVKEQFVSLDGTVKIQNVNDQIRNLSTTNNKFREALFDSFGGNGVDAAEITADNVFVVDEEWTDEHMHHNEDGSPLYQSGDTIRFLPMSIKVRLKEGNTYVSYSGQVAHIFATVVYSGETVQIAFDGSESVVLNKDVKLW